jgi:hypothetical protein
MINVEDCPLHDRFMLKRDVKHANRNELEWFDLVPLYSQSSFSIRGRPLNDSDARFKFFEIEPLSLALFGEFSWTVSIDEPPADLIGNNLSWLIVSDRGKQALSAVPNLVAEFLEIPEHILGAARYACRAWLFHPMERIRALDIRRSKLTWSSIGAEHVSSIQKLCVNRQAVKNASSVFRLQEYEPLIMVNSNFKNAWERARCRGIHFKPITVSS